MFVRQRNLEAAQDEIARLRGELEQMRASLAQYQSQERELVDALVWSRGEARQMRTLAEAQAKELVEAARAQATSAQAQAREVVERARAEANDVEAQARERAAAVENEIARLRQVHGELGASLQQSLAALNQVIPNASGLPPPTASGSKRVLTPSAPASPWAPAATKRNTDSRSGWESALGAPGQTVSPAALDRPAPRSAPQQREIVPAWAGGILSLLQSRKGAVIVAVAAVGILSLAARVGVPAVWRQARTEVKSSLDRASSPSIAAAAATLPESGSPSLTGAATGPNTTATGLTVALKAVRAVWLRADIDGRTSPARLMKAGEDLELRGAREVVVRVGDAGALLVGLNGRTPTRLGQTGAVVTKRFEPEPHNEAVPAAGAPRADGSPVPAMLPSSSPNARTPRSTEARSQGAPFPASYQRTGRTRSPAPVPETGVRGPGRMTAATGGNDEADVLRAHEAYFDALRKGDSGALNRVLADGFSASGSPAMTDSGLPHPISLGNASVEIRGLGAVVSGIASQHITGPDGQRLRDQPLMFSEVWVKRDGQWQLMNVRFVSPGGTR